MNNFLKRQIANIICGFLPPILAQRIRAIIYSENDGIFESANFRKKSITGSIFSGNTADIHAYTFSVNGFYDWRNVAIARSVCRNGDEIIEIGANIGTETICFSDIIGKQGKIFAFEPLESNVYSLHENIRINSKKNIEIFPVAISNIEGNIAFAPPINYHMSGTGSLDPSGKRQGKTIDVICWTLDSHLELYKNLRCIFIDIEGADYLAILGGHQTIRRFRPVIVMESSPNLMKRYGYSQEDVIETMDSLGYQCYTISKISLSRVLCNGKKNNWVCIPKEKMRLRHRINLFIIIYALLPNVFLRLLVKKNA